MFYDQFVITSLTVKEHLLLFVNYIFGHFHEKIESPEIYYAYASIITKYDTNSFLLTFFIFSFKKIQITNISFYKFITILLSIERNELGVVFW